MVEDSGLWKGRRFAGLEGRGRRIEKPKVKASRLEKQGQKSAFDMVEVKGFAGKGKKQVVKQGQKRG